MAIKVAQVELAALGVVTMVVKVDPAVAVCWEVAELALESALAVISVEAAAPGVAIIMKNQ